MGKRNVFKIASIYIGTLIGAGFASGQETMRFFTRYGIKGIYGVLVTAILFGMIGSIILVKVYNYKIISYHDWILPFFGPYLGKVVEFFLAFLLLSFYCVMLAGSGALFEQQFGYGKEIGMIFMSVITFITFIFSMRGLAIVNSIVVPLLIVGIIAIGVFVIPQNLPFDCNVDGNFYTIGDNWMTSCILYVSYNSICAVMVLSSLYPLLNNKRDAVLGGGLGGALLGVMLLFLFLSTLIVYRAIQDVEIPMIAIASTLGENMGNIYGILLWFAMLTTAIANGFVFIQSMEKRLKIKHLQACILFFIVTIPLAQFGFKRLVHVLYPMFGYIGVLFIILLVLKKGKK
ncbi:YkvI family membrane protein [Crassaminicella profunda]|uniref:YkvI family membrane protein n=1 Tax=Crassaminicella profunda TaxID=1286698 RepID=UPI001CA70ADD|nr:hypothetical protein [Crassaminicella profunda]QZY55113.1 hypothetical protein K7H06_19255 [Crassaminicella profunda]